MNLGVRRSRPEAARAAGGETPPGAALEVRGLTKLFGGFTAVASVSFTAVAGQALGLVGPNGSGKTTLINVISGVYKPSAGSVLLGEHEITGLPSHRVCRMGLNRTFQVPRPLGDLTVADNIAIVHPGVPARIQRLTDDPLQFVGLGDSADRLVSSLTSGEQKLLDLARALAANPDVLLVDELGAGLSDSELDHVAGLLSRLKEAGLALVVVEHLMGFLEQVVDSVLVLNAGAPIFRGSLRDAIADDQVIDVFLGQ